MATKIETLRAPRQVSPWLVIGAAAALIAALAVLTVPESAVTTREPAVTTARVTSEAAEVADLKSAVAHRYMVERFGVGELVSPTISEARAIWALKAGIAGEYLGAGFTTSESPPAVTEDALEAAVKARLVHGVLETSPSEPEKGHPVRRTG